MFVGREFHFDTLSQELRLEGQHGRSLNGIRWIAGAYADRDENDWRFTQKTPRVLLLTHAEQKAHTAAFFTHWTIPLATHWNLLAGIRLEKNDVRFRPYGLNEAERQRTWRHVSPKFALQYQNGSMQVYASHSDGFRAGGFNTFSPAASQRDYRPEKLGAWEIGIKGYALAHRLFYSAAIYHMSVRDMQVQQMPAPGLVFVSNAAHAHSMGAEGELRYRQSAEKYSLTEDNAWVKVLDGFFGELPVIGMFTGYFFNPSYSVKDASGKAYFQLKKMPSFFGRRFQLHKLNEVPEEDETLIILSLLMMVLLERARG